MSTNTLTSTATTSQPQHGADDVRLTFPRLVRSEWIKFRTLRSTIWTLASMVVVMVGTVTLYSAFGASKSDGTAGGEVGGSIVVFYTAALLAQLAVVVLGVLVITGEYCTGMIRSTLAAGPTRLPSLWAKGVVLTVSIFVVSTVGMAISLGAMQLILGAKGFAPDLGASETVRILVGSPFLPQTAGLQLLLPQEQIDAMAQGASPVLGPWAGFAVLLVWVAAPLAAAAVLLKKRNA